MAIQTILCPHCGQETKVNTARDTAFCENCGKQLGGGTDLTLEKHRLAADRAFDGADYLEAYTLYGGVCELCPTDYRAQFRKGLCAGHLSVSSDLRVEEVLEGYRSAVALLRELENSNRVDRDYAAHEKQEMSAALLRFAVGNGKTLMRVRSKPVFSSKQEAEKFAHCVRDGIALLCAVDETAADEDAQKQLLSCRIEVCDLGLKCAKLRYEKEQTDENGELKQETVTFSAPRELISYAKAKRLDAVDRYNALPSIVAEANRLQSGIEAEEVVILDYKKRRKAFLRADKELRSKLRKQQLLVLAGALVLVAVFVILGITVGKLWLYIAAAACLLLGWCVQMIFTGRFEKQNFPSDLLKRRSEYRQSKRQLRKKKGEQSKFKSEKMKK